MQLLPSMLENGLISWCISFKEHLVTCSSGITLAALFNFKHSIGVQDFIVRGVRQALFETTATFQGDLGNEHDLRRLIEIQLTSLQNAFRLSAESSDVMSKRVAIKLLNLYRTGRLGHYTLDHVPDVRQEVAA
jgi:hypothetical protein